MNQAKKITHETFIITEDCDFPMEKIAVTAKEFRKNWQYYGNNFGRVIVRYTSNLLGVGPYKEVRDRIKDAVLEAWENGEKSFTWQL